MNRSIFAIGLVSLSGAAFAQQAPGPDFVIEYSGAPNVPVVTYHVETAIESDDNEPLMRVYGDGRVVVHKPWFRADAGDYQMKLSDAEMAALLTELHESGVMDYDAKAVAEERHAARVQRANAARAGQSVELTHNSDVEVTIIRIQLDSYRAQGAARATTNFVKEVRTTDVQNQSREFPQVAALQGVANAESALRAVTTDARLRKIPGSGAR